MIEIPEKCRTQQMFEGMRDHAKCIIDMERSKRAAELVAWIWAETHPLFLPGQEGERKLAEVHEDFPVEVENIDTFKITLAWIGWRDHKNVVYLPTETLFMEKADLRNYLTTVSEEQTQKEVKREEECRRALRDWFADLPKVGEGYDVTSATAEEIKVEDEVS